MTIANRFVRLLALLALLCAGLPRDALGDAVDDALATLARSNLRATAEAIDGLAGSDSPHAVTVLTALRDGELVIRRADARVVIARPVDQELALSDPLTGAALGTVATADIRKIIVNNSMRTRLRTLVARLSLHAPDAAARLAAVNSLFGNVDADTLALLREALPAEGDAEVREAMTQALALGELDAPDPARRIAAIGAVSTSMRSDVYNRLTALLATDASGTPVEADAGVRSAATVALGRIDTRRQWYRFIETGFFGLSLGMVLVLSAIGLAITFGVMGVINMAHGELMMLGAYATWAVQQLMPNHLEASLFVAIPVAFVVSAAVGVAIERGVVRRLYGRPLETLLATFGISLILQQAVRTAFSPLNRSVVTPAWMSGQLVVNEALAFTYNRLWIVVFGVVVFLALISILQFTTLGLQVRAVAQNRAMARCMGVRAGWVDAATFGLGSGVAGLAGVALSQITNVGPNLGQSYIIDSFMVVVFGGVGNLWGTLVAGLSLGMANKFLEPWAGAVLAKILMLVFIILFIQKRPRGLFPQRGRAAEG